MDSAAQRRELMVARDIAGRGIADERVLAAMRAVPRERFIPEALRDHAYDDRPLPIGADQTISQPYIVALMCEALQLRGDERVLEIGTGSAYSAALLGRLAARVDTVERIAELAESAERRLLEAGVTNVRVHCGDGTLGWPEAAPYEAIVVTAGGPAVPAALRAQLAPGGRLVMPVDTGQGWQRLMRVIEAGPGIERSESLGDVVFVPLVGEQGWPEPGAHR